MRVQLNPAIARMEQTARMRGERMEGGNEPPADLPTRPFPGVGVAGNPVYRD